MENIISILHDYSKEALNNYNPKNMNWDYDETILLLGAQELHKTIYKELYFHFILRFLDDKIDGAGDVKSIGKERLSSDEISTGVLLFHAFEESKKLKFIKTIEKFEKYLEYEFKEISEEIFWNEKYYTALPFYLKYDTEFGGKKNYNWVLKILEKMEKNLDDRELGDYLISILESLDNMSEESFYEYRGFQKFLKKSVDESLKRSQMRDLNLAYILMKGARQFHLKYEYKKLGLEIFKEEFKKYEKEIPKCSRTIGLILLCQNEIILMNK